MRELARRRRGRDIRISRGHLWAAGAVCALVGIGGFLVGLWVGGARSAPAPAVAIEAADESLVELLARVNELSLAADAAERLTFPDVLVGVEVEHELPQAEPEERPSSVAPGEPGLRPFDIVIAPAEQASRPALAQAVAALGIESELEPDGPLVVRAPDLSQARELRDRLIAALSEAELDAEVSVRPTPLAPVAAAAE